MLCECLFGISLQWEKVQCPSYKQNHFLTCEKDVHLMGKGMDSQFKIESFLLPSSTFEDQELLPLLTKKMKVSCHQEVRRAIWHKQMQ